MSDTTPDKTADEARARRIATSVHTLSELVGSHPETLRALYREGEVADPLALGAEPRGRLLALEPGIDVYMLTRPLLRALGGERFPWSGKVFDHGGNSGRDVVFGKPVFRFHAEVAPSELDGKPTLVLRYGDAAFKNPWPVRMVVDELRSIGDGLALGNAFLEIGSTKRLVLWWGLEAVATS